MVHGISVGPRTRSTLFVNRYQQNEDNASYNIMANKDSVFSILLSMIEVSAGISVCNLPGRPIPGALIKFMGAIRTQDQAQFRNVNIFGPENVKIGPTM